MRRNSLLGAALVSMALLLGACGPRTVDQVQPIKFQYTRSEAVAGLPSLANDFHPRQEPVDRGPDRPARGF